jgi:uncharacterized SAM-binding protein YcdF (DUF218 family)
MFLLSKLLPLLLLPLGLALLLLLWAVCNRRGGRGGRAAVLAALAILWVCSTPLTAEALWRWLERPYQRRTAAALLGPRPQPVRAVVVLGTGRHAAPGPARVSEWIDADRFFGGLEVYRQLRSAGQRPRLIFTGGWWPTRPAMPPEGDVLRQRAIALGLPPADLLSTPRVRNTAEEARAIAALLPRGAPIVLVTSAFHLPRALRLFERQGLRPLAFPVDFQASGDWAGSPLTDPLNWLPSAEGLAASSRALREVIGRSLYRAW